MAVPPLLESVAKNPTKASYHYHLGLAYAALGNRDKARAAFEKSLALDGTSRAAGEIRQALANLKS
jgi:Flp pilus assembly protein TadD